MNTGMIKNIVRTDGYKVINCDISASERRSYNRVRSGRGYYLNEDGEDEGEFRITRRILLTLARDNEVLDFQEEYESDAEFGRDAAVLCGLISESGITPWRKNHGYCVDMPM